jgi:chaperonin GroES
MKPLYERILVKPREKETKTKNGIMLPEKAVKRPNIATVIACGDGTPNNPMLVKPGDLILCNRFAGAELYYKGEKHYVILSNEVIGILEDENEVQLDEFE